jgi:hypothetical protein
MRACRRGSRLTILARALQPLTARFRYRRAFKNGRMLRRAAVLQARQGNATEAAEHSAHHGGSADSVRTALLRPSGSQGAAHHEARRGGRGVRERLLQQPLVRPLTLLDARRPPAVPDRRLRQRERVPGRRPDHRAWAARRRLSHLPRGEDALRRPGPAARLRGAPDHRHLSSRLRLDAQLGCARGADRVVGTTTF